MALDKNVLLEEVSVSAIWGEYLWRWPRFYGKISTRRDSHVLTIWRGTPAKYDIQLSAF